MIGRTNAVIAKSGSKWPLADDVQVTYSGTMKDPREITDAAGNKYILYELTSSGTLTVDKQVPVDICIVKGGQAGGSYNNSDYNYGGSGGTMINATVVLNGEMPCIVGEGGGVGLSYGQSLEMGGISSIEIDSYTYSSDDYGRRYGTGAGKGAGGSGFEPNNSRGDGKTKYVFGDESVYDYPICAGGGGGASYQMSGAEYRSITRGGDGGTNGGNGEDHSSAMMNPETDTQYWETIPYVEPSLGGYYGGGNGAGIEEGGSVILPTNGFTYGSGGGGARNYYGVSSWGGGDEGLGYQGVIFIRIPK